MSLLPEPEVVPAFQRLSHDLLRYLVTIICLSDPLNGLMLISKISRSWRLAALDSPLMWCNITICLCTSAQQHLLALAYFERSKDFPVSLTIQAHRDFQPLEKIKLILPYAHRFHSLRVEVSSGFLANLLWLGLNVPMPRLETFESVISQASRIIINSTLDETVIIPSISTRNRICWDSWNPTGLTALTLDTTCLSNKPDLDDIYNALSTTCDTIQRFEYVGLIACMDVGVNIRTRLYFPELRSLAVLCHDDMVPLLRLMKIPALDSLILRDFIAYPNTIPTIHKSELMDIIELAPDLTFDPDCLIQVIREWNSITHLEIFGIEDVTSDELSPLPDLLGYIKSLNQLSSLVLFGIGMATTIAHTLFMHDPMEEPLLPQLSHFLLAINDSDMAPNGDLCHYLTTRRRYNLPRLQKLSVNSKYIQHVIEHINILWESSDNIFIIADPEFGEPFRIEENNLLTRE